MVKLSTTYTVTDKRLLKNFSRRTMSQVLSVSLDYITKEVTFTLAESTCMDMGKAIESAKELFPEVTYIIAQTPTRVDTCYLLVNGKWQVADHVTYKSIENKRLT